MNNDKNLQAITTGVSIPVAGLSTRQNSWRIKHPQAVTKPRTICYPFLLASLFWLAGLYPIWGYGSGAKENAPALPSLVWQCFAATRSALVSTTKDDFMIYTFLIARAGRISALNRIRTVSAFGSSEAEARAALSGLPLVFVSRIPAARAAA